MNSLNDDIIIIKSGQDVDLELTDSTEFGIGAQDATTLDWCIINLCSLCCCCCGGCGGAATVEEEEITL